MKEKYKNLSWYSRETIPHQFPITNEEKLKLADIMVEARTKIVQLENDLAVIKKNYKEQIDAQTGELSDAAKKYKVGLADPVKVLCDLYQDFETSEMVYVSLDDNQEIMRRPLQDKETQPLLFSSIDRTGSSITKFSSQ